MAIVKSGLLQQTKTLSIGPSKIEHDGVDLSFHTREGVMVTLDELMVALKDIDMLKGFIEDSSLGEEYKEYKTFRKLQE